ncbi:SDR family oxidoreductase [Halobacterium rubrum]|uniref:SDR family oxidoreductase n=1 Tax=Halobacterium TaxID=2239 RepID=UPI001F29A33D|nr:MULTISPECIES: SDR family oxidoreductase [Halobacterium]MDH5021084.1 SDR family oxidoreductase [Halobacterium rubrum]
MGTDYLDGGAAVVTGGSSGIGRAISLAAAEAGADVVVADLQRKSRDPDEDESTVDLVARETDQSAAFVECDVTDPSDTAAAVATADDFGGVTTMVNNAGVFSGGGFLDATEADFSRLMDVNVKGTFFGAQAAAERMVEDGDGGAIVNLSSVAGLEGSAGFATYCASKGAVRLLTYSLAAELGPEGVRVNAIHPGVIETAMTTDDVPIVGTESGDEYLEDIPSRRFGDPGDVADAAVFLASAAGDYVNGESLTVDGGMTNTN